jgi:hypothetical protein
MKEGTHLIKIFFGVTPYISNHGSRSYVKLASKDNSISIEVLIESRSNEHTPADIADHIVECLTKGITDDDR